MSFNLKCDLCFGQIKYITTNSQFHVLENGKVHSRRTTLPPRGFLPHVVTRTRKLLSEGKIPSKVLNLLAGDKNLQRDHIPTLTMIQNLKSRMTQDAESDLGLRTIAQLRQYLDDEINITNDPLLRAAKSK